MTLRRWCRRWLGVTSLRAIRGATSVAADEPALLAEAVTELIGELSRVNGLSDNEIVSAVFTATPDLVCAFPASAARAAGWCGVPLLSATEVAVPDGLERCIRVLLHVERDWTTAPPRHIYLRRAAALRPDWVADRWRAPARDEAVAR